MKTVLSVGHCGYDGPRIQKLLEEKHDATVQSASTIKEALEKVHENSYDLVIVNRIFDKNKESGIELIGLLHDTSPAQKTMLVSNYEDAQKEAVEKGALFGFGKKSLAATETEKTLKDALNETSEVCNEDEGMK